MQPAFVHIFMYKVSLPDVAIGILIAGQRNLMQLNLVQHVFLWSLMATRAAMSNMNGMAPAVVVAN